mmetsp:Transcript_14209/g.36327  ORF Transcript_14209/g.36327 Transcript_14209/m.36327 type:complete len:214 (-) Transcript_14209:3-644(-)
MAEAGYSTCGPSSAGISAASVTALAREGSKAMTTPPAVTTAEVPRPTLATGAGNEAPPLTVPQAWRKTLAASGDVRTTVSNGPAAPAPAAASSRKRASNASKPAPGPCSMQGTSTTSTAPASTSLPTRACAKAFRSFPFWPASRVRATRSGGAAAPTAAQEAAPRRPVASPAQRSSQHKWRPWARLRPSECRSGMRPDAPQRRGRENRCPKSP